MQFNCQNFLSSKTFKSILKARVTEYYYCCKVAVPSHCCIVFTLQNILAVLLCNQTVTRLYFKHSKE